MIYILVAYSSNYAIRIIISLALRVLKYLRRKEAHFLRRKCSLYKVQTAKVSETQVLALRSADSKKILL